MGLRLAGGPLRLGRGAGVQIKRTSSAFSPLSLSPVLWLKADAGLGTPADGDRISTWADQSGNGHTATQAGVAGIKPVYKANILNGKPCLRAADSEYMTLGDLSAAFPTAATLFVVATINTDTQYCLYETGVSNSYWHFGDGNGYMGAFRSARKDTYPASPFMPSTGSHYFTVISSASTYQVRLDGVAATATTAAYAAGTSHQIFRGDSGALLNGDIFEVIAYGSALSAGNITSVEGYLKTRYGL